MPKCVIRTIIVVVLTASIIACASGQLSSIQQDIEAKMFSVPSNKDKGRVYVVRPMGFLGAAGGALTPIVVDGRIVTLIGSKNFFVLDVSIGKHIFDVLGWVSPALSYKKKLLQIDVAPGKLYFIEVQHSEAAMTLLSEEEGRRLVRESKRIETNF